MSARQWQILVVHTAALIAAIWFCHWLYVVVCPPPMESYDCSWSAAPLSTGLVLVSVIIIAGILRASDS